MTKAEKLYIALLAQAQEQRELGHLQRAEDLEDAARLLKGTTIDDVREKILRGAISRYGRGVQQHKAIEELSELIRALARADDPENVAEEMADVRIMLDQLELMFGNGEVVRKWELRKLHRLDRMIHAADRVL